MLRLRNADFSREPKAVQALNDDSFIANEVQPAKIVAALVRADERLKKSFPLVTLPVFYSTSPSKGHEAERQPVLLRYGRIQG